MPEQSSNIEFAHKLHEKSHTKTYEQKERLEVRIEILEAFLLAIVAVASAWCGYQSARWDGNSAANYAQATAYRVDGDSTASLGGQEHLQDITNFNTWLQAKAAGNEKITQLLEKRFSADYKFAFTSWLSTDPFNNSDAPAGPGSMSQYHNHREKEGEELLVKASETFEAARSARETGEDYVRLTVFLATVLFLVAVAQRFKAMWPRLGLLGIAVIATAITVALIFTYPRA